MTKEWRMQETAGYKQLEKFQMLAMSSYLLASRLGAHIAIVADLTEQNSLRTESVRANCYFQLQIDSTACRRRATLKMPFARRQLCKLFVGGGASPSLYRPVPSCHPSASSELQF